MSLYKVIRSVQSHSRKTHTLKNARVSDQVGNIFVNDDDTLLKYIPKWHYWVTRLDGTTDFKD